MLGHEFNEKLIKEIVKPPLADSHKGENGKILIIAGSSLFHGAGLLTAQALNEVLVYFASITNDMVYFCSTDENIKYLKAKIDNFIGVRREVLDNYIKEIDVILSGPGLMREIDEKNNETHKEPEFTLFATKKILESDKKLVLDAGSIQVISPQDLKGKENIIITPHRKEMANLFSINVDDLITKHDFTEEEIEKVGEKVFKIAKEYKITILLKGPIDIVAGENGWYFIKGGSVGMTKGGTGDVLAGLTGALFTRRNDPLLTAAAASYINKKAGEALEKKNTWFFNSSDLVKEIPKVLKEILVESVNKL